MPINKTMYYQLVQDQLFKSKKDSDDSNTIHPKKVGIEIESFPMCFSSSTNKLKLLDLPKILSNKTFQYRNWKVNPANFSIKLDCGSVISIEPGGQLEISSPPCLSINELVKKMSIAQNLVDDYLFKHDTKLIQAGYNAWSKSEDIVDFRKNSVIDHCLKTYDSIRPDGASLFKQTSSIHVCLDCHHDKEMTAKRFIASNLLSPLAIATFANSPFYSKKKSRYKSVRSALFYEMNHYQNGFPALENIENISYASCIQLYTDLLLKTKVTIPESKDTGTIKQIAFIELAKNNNFYSTPELIEELIANFRPQVRMRGDYIEIRAIDSLPRKWQYIPLIYFSALLYNDNALDKILNLLPPYAGDILPLWEASIYGLQDDTLFDLSKKIMSIALDSIDTFDAEFISASTAKTLQQFAENLTFNRYCPADQLSINSSLEPCLVAAR